MHEKSSLNVNVNQITVAVLSLYCKWLFFVKMPPVSLLKVSSLICCELIKIQKLLCVLYSSFSAKTEGSGYRTTCASLNLKAYSTTPSPVT